MPTPTGFGPALMGVIPTDVSGGGDQFPKFPPMQEVDYNGGRYIYVKHLAGTGAVATANGMPAYWSDVANGSVTADKSDGQQGGTAGAHGAMVAGIYQGITTAGYFTWLQKRGVRAGVLIAAGDSNGLAGNAVFPPITNVDGTLRSEALDSISAEEITAQRVGYQLGAGTGNTITCFLQII